jgi:hypothetical protein
MSIFKFEGDTFAHDKCHPEAKVILAAIEQVNKLTVKPLESASYQDPYVLFEAVYDLQLSVPVYTIVFTKDCLFVEVRYSNHEG